MSTESYIYVDLPGQSPDADTIFLFHGTGGDEQQFVELAAQLLPGARRISPRGDVSEAGANRFFRRHAEGRYDMPDLARATAKMADFVRERTGGGSGGGQTIGLGYSNGANILASVQFAAPELFDVAVLLHPMIPFEPRPQLGLAGKRVLITAGRRDPICPAPMTETLANYYRAQGAEVALYWHEGGHEIRRDELAAISDYLRKI